MVESKKNVYTMLIITVMLCNVLDLKLGNSYTIPVPNPN